MFRAKCPAISEKMSPPSPVARSVHSPAFSPSSTTSRLSPGLPNTSPIRNFPRRFLPAGNIVASSDARRAVRPARSSSRSLSLRMRRGSPDFWMSLKSSIGGTSDHIAGRGRQRQTQCHAGVGQHRTRVQELQGPLRRRQRVRSAQTSAGYGGECPEGSRWRARRSTENRADGRRCPPGRQRGSPRKSGTSAPDVSNGPWSACRRKQKLSETSNDPATVRVVTLSVIPDGSAA